MSDLPELLSVREFAKLNKCSVTKTYRLIWAGAIPCVRIGHSVRILRSDAERIVLACRRPADPAKALPGALSEQDAVADLEATVSKLTEKASKRGRHGRSARR